MNNKEWKLKDLVMIFVIILWTGSFGEFFSSSEKTSHIKSIFQELQLYDNSILIDENQNRTGFYDEFEGSAIIKVDICFSWLDFFSPYLYLSIELVWFFFQSFVDGIVCLEQEKLVTYSLWAILWINIW